MRRLPSLPPAPPPHPPASTAYQRWPCPPPLLLPPAWPRVVRLVVAGVCDGCIHPLPSSSMAPWVFFFGGEEGDCGRDGEEGRGGGGKVEERTGG